MSKILAVSIPKAGEILGLGRSTIYRLIKEGQIRPKKVGRRTLILVADLKKFLEFCPDMSGPENLKVTVSQKHMEGESGL